ncbi:MAG: hypothetical protein ICV56_04175 [Nitrososphaeraceae archaeon]|nr:hypothetical protein [Nitrososphaeraceae archaeon]
MPDEKDEEEDDDDEDLIEGFENEDLISFMMKMRITITKMELLKRRTRKE